MPIRPIGIYRSVPLGFTVLSHWDISFFSTGIYHFVPLGYRPIEIYYLVWFPDKVVYLRTIYTYLLLPYYDIA